MHIEITIPVHPAVPKFLAYRYKISPFAVNTSNPHSAFLHFLIRKKIPEKKDNLSAIKLASFTCKLSLSFGINSKRKNGSIFKADDVLAFNRFIIELLYQELFLFVDIHRYHGKKIKVAVQAFCDQYHLDQKDITFKTLLKRYERYRKET